MTLRTAIRTALYAAGREVAMELYDKPIVSAEEIEKKMIDRLGKSRLDESLLVEGSRGLDCSRTKKHWNSTVVDLSVCYRVKFPLPFFSLPILNEEETLRIKGWTGYEGDGFGTNEGRTVYVTEYGVVYHKDRDCTYLDLSLQEVQQDKIDDLRNQDGRKYKPCTSCGGKSEEEFVYVTIYGERYHSSLTCSKLKRRVYEVALKDVLGLGGCSKCVK